MNSKAKWLTAILLAGWFFLPGATEAPCSGLPLTRIGLFAFVAVWCLLVVVLPWRARRGGAWFYSSLGSVATLIVLKLTAGLISTPRGLAGTYESLVGVSDLRPYVNAALGRGKDPPARPGHVWHRVDRELQFADNGFSPFADSFHLQFLNQPPLADRPKSDRPTAKASQSPELDRSAMMVTWRGSINFPRQGLYVFQPDTDGYWSVWLGGDLGLVQAGGPGIEPLYQRKSIEPGPHEVVIRYLRPAYPADPSQARPAPMRFELRWDPPRGGDQAVTWRRFFPESEVSDTRIVLNHVAEGLQWTAFGGACLLGLAWAIFLVDWRAALRPFFTDRMILFLMSLPAFGIGLLETTASVGGDPNWCIPDNAVERRALTRALLIWHRGEPPAASAPPAPVQAGTLPPAVAAPPDLSDNVVTNLWLKTVAVAADGLLGPTRWPAAPAECPEPFPDTPLLDYYLAGLLWMFDERLGIACLFQTLLTIATMLLVYGIGRVAFGPQAGLLAAGALCLDLHFSSGSAVLLADHPAAFLTAASIFAVMLARRARRLVWFNVAGVLLGSVFLMRPDLALLPVVAGAWLLWPKYGDGHVRTRLANVAAVIVPILMLWSLVPVRNHQLAAEALWLPTELATRAWVGNGFSSDTPSPTLSDFVGRVFEQPAEFGERMWVKFLHLWGIGRYAVPPGEAGRAETLTTLRYVLMPMLYLAVLAVMLWRTLFARRDAEVALVLLAVAAVAVPMLVLDFQDRYRLPMIPLLHVFTGALVWAVISGRRVRPGIAYPIVAAPQPAPTAAATAETADPSASVRG